MPWRANVVYTAPIASTIDAFRKRALGDALYVVRDLQGLRFEWARREFFEQVDSEIRHGLPERGLLAVMPPIIRTNYDDASTWIEQRAAQAQFDDGYGDPPATKWEKAGFAGRGYIAEFPAEVDWCHWLQWPTGLHSALTDIANETGEPLVHYFAESSGGPPDIEVAFVASPGWPLAVIANKDGDETRREPLVDALAFLGLELPTRFFAPHASSFDWTRYALRT